jgi:hypothetical protein
VDDVLIMTKSSVTEWEEINKILDVFCSATGLMINVQKSTFLHFGVHQGTLEYLKDLFHYNFNDLSEGFRYLGFFLKPDSYKVEDWQWLISKFEKVDKPLVQSLAIPGWSLRAYKRSFRESTSLLDGLAHIPSTVLNRIRQLVFSFLWSGSKQKQSYHLCRWETLTRPKKYGGWGLRNILCFYRALATNTLWRVLIEE